MCHPRMPCVYRARDAPSDHTTTPSSQVAAQAGQYIKYKCGKGECGTCEVRVDGKWIRTCAVQVPFVGQGEVYQVHVRHSMKEPKKSSRFYSFKCAPLAPPLLPRLRALARLARPCAARCP